MCIKITFSEYVSVQGKYKYTIFTHTHANKDHTYTYCNMHSVTTEGKGKTNMQFFDGKILLFDDLPPARDKALDQHISNQRHY